MQKNQILVLLAASVGFAAAAKTINITPGTLEGKLLGNTDESELVITGTGDVRDLMQLASLPGNVAKIDIAGLNITEYSATQPVWEERSYFPANELPCYIFFKSQAKEIVLPKTLTGIADGAFAGAEIKEIVFPELLLSIGSHAFYDCKELDSVKFNPALHTIGDWAFARCQSLKSVDMTNTQIAKIPERCFINCSALQNVTLSPRTTEIGKEVFSGTSIAVLNLNNVTTADSYALVGMSELRDVYLNNSGKYGEGMLMANKNLRNINGMPLDLPGLFAANCNNLQLDRQLGDINSAGKYSLAGTSANNLVLGRNLTSLDRGSLKGISNLAEIDVTRLEGNVPATDAETFLDINQPEVTLVVDHNYADTWRNAPVWQNFNVKTNLDVKVDAASADTDIQIAVSDGRLAISAGDVLENVDVYASDGRLLFSATPNQSIYTTPANFSEKVIIIRVAAGGKVKTSKIHL